MIEVHESFQVPASPDAVWAIISTPEDVVTCIPGATLEERHEDGSYSGFIVVQFGPAKVRFNATVTFEVDEMARVGKVTGRGKDSVGGTRATMSFIFSVAADGEGTAVAGDGGIDVTGKLASMIETGASFVVKRMLGEFSTRLTERCAPPSLEVEVPGEGWTSRLKQALTGRRKTGPASGE